MPGPNGDYCPFVKEAPTSPEGQAALYLANLPGVLRSDGSADYAAALAMIDPALDARKVGRLLPVAIGGLIRGVSASREKEQDKE